MKLWHDDVRPAPYGWHWARTNEEAQDILLNHHVEEISLDHDMKPEHYGSQESLPGSGLHLVRWMMMNERVPSKVTIHSWNYDGAQRMAQELRSVGIWPTMRKAVR